MDKRQSGQRHWQLGGERPLVGARLSEKARESESWSLGDMGGSQSGSTAGRLRRNELLSAGLEGPGSLGKSLSREGDMDSPTC